MWGGVQQVTAERDTALDSLSNKAETAQLTLAELTRDLLSRVDTTRPGQGSGD